MRSFPRTGTAFTIITGNRDASEWLATFDGTPLVQSAVDRFKNSTYDLIIDGESYRSRDLLAQLAAKSKRPHPVWGG